MLRVKMNKAYIKRTFRPLYGWTQMTPKSVFLDPAWGRAVDIYPGMVMQRNGGDLVTLAGAAPGGSAANITPYGFAALYVGGDGIDEPLDSGINAYAVWVMSADAEAEIMAPAFDVDTLGALVEPTGSAATSGYLPGGGNSILLTSYVSGPKQGKLVPLGATGAPTTGSVVGTKPLCKLLKVNAATKITVGGLSPADTFGTYPE